MLIRDLVFEILSKERDRQDGMYEGAKKPTFDDINTLGDWVLYIEAYLERAKSKFFARGIIPPISRELYLEDPVTAHDVHRREVLKDIAKVAALCVATLEYLGEPADFDIPVLGGEPID